MSEKTEKATPYKLQKAREKGQVSKSVELTSCISALAMLGLVTAMWPSKLQEIKNLLHYLLSVATHMQISLANINRLHQFMWQELVSFWAPFALTVITTVILSNIAQSGIVWSSTPLIPDFKRLNLIQGCKKLFSIKTCYETGKSLVKLITASTLLFWIIKHQLHSYLQLSLIPISLQPSLIMGLLLKTIFQLFILLLALAVIDKLYTRWKFAKEQRMSKQELKDEYKQREGDPKIKGRIKQLQHQLRKKTASLKQIQIADVLVTNPTHLAIALKYDRLSMPAPQVVCKAQGEMVFEAKKLAKKHSVPIIENKSFARLLHATVELNQYIHKELYPIAAPIFKEIYAYEKEKQ